MAGRIEDYALIGDTQTTALVCIDGSIDWWCAPRFDSGACFSALLGDETHGRFKLAPTGPVLSTTRRYRGDTLVLETEFTTDTGRAAVIDFMPIVDGGPSIVRIVEGREGTVAFDLEVVARFDYGSILPWALAHDGGITYVAGTDGLCLDGTVKLAGRNFTTVGEFIVEAGHHESFTIQWYPAHTDKPGPIRAHEAMVETESLWQLWSSRCRYDGEWAPDVIRSLITLKALSYRATGGIVAAPTTSLPEQIGGVRNWDYRYCWLRDATFTLHAFLTAGYAEEAMEWSHWLRRAVAGSPGDFQIMYGVGGERRLVELELDWLPGYEDSAPVRIGNGASGQFQLDVFGEIMDAAHVGRQLGRRMSDDAWDVELALMEHLEEVWTEPDDGIWEIRGERRHFTHSKVMAWVAVDRAVKAVEQFGRSGPLPEWRVLRDRIHAEVCEKGFNKEKNAFVQSYGAEELDASTLMLALVGFLPAEDPRIIGTVEAIQRELTVDGFVQRYRTDESGSVDGLPAGEGAFLMTSFWLADNLALMGRVDEAREIFERLRGLRNDVGLFAEEYDPTLGRMVGNFPQAFSHVAFINAAATLTKAGSGPCFSRANPHLELDVPGWPD